MSLKKLYQFETFNWELFESKIKIMVIAQRPWEEYGTGNILGTQFEVVIIEDKHEYQGQKEGSTITNSFEKFTVKVPGEIRVPVNTVVTLKGAKATVWGNEGRRDRLAVRAEAIEAITKEGR